MTTIQARLAPWALNRIVKDYGKVTKTTLRQSFKDVPGTEMHTIASVVQRGGACFSVTDTGIAPASIELRYPINGVPDVGMAVIEVHPSGSVVIR